MRIVLVGTMPEAQMQDLLCLLRSFESQHPNVVHLSISVDAPTLSMEDAVQLLARLTPPLPCVWQIPRQPEPGDAS